MNQNELVMKIAQLSGVPKTAVAQVLKTAGDVIASGLKDGAEVTLPGLGKLYVKHRAARNGKNPKTGAAIQIPASKAPGFKPAKSLKDAVNT